MHCLVAQQMSASASGQALTSCASDRRSAQLALLLLGPLSGGRLILLGAATGCLPEKQPMAPLRAAVHRGGVAPALGRPSAGCLLGIPPACCFPKVSEKPTRSPTGIHFVFGHHNSHPAANGAAGVEGLLTPAPLDRLLSTQATVAPDPHVACNQNKAQYSLTIS